MFGKARRQQQHIDHLAAHVRNLTGLSRVLAERAGVDQRELAALEADADPGLTSEVRGLADRGDAVAAIRAYRVATGAGLIEAKDAIDAYTTRRP